MAVYKFYKLSFEGWADRISADKSQAEKWRILFSEHPEFFRLDGNKEKAWLVWRRRFPRRYDVDLERALSIEEYSALSSECDPRISRIPLPSSDIKALVDTAVNLNFRALEQRKDKRWWLMLACAGDGLLGRLLGKLIP